MNPSPLPNNPLSPTYQKELAEIRKEIKKGQCHHFKECLDLYQKLWHEKHDHELLLSPTALKKLEKLSHNDPEQYAHLQNKLEQILNNPEHYKPLGGDLHGFRRVHIKDYVLIYQIEHKNIIVTDYDHHDKIYGKK